MSSSNNNTSHNHKYKKNNNKSKKAELELMDIMQNAITSNSPAFDKVCQDHPNEGLVMVLNINIDKKNIILTTIAGPVKSATDDDKKKILEIYPRHTTLSSRLGLLNKNLIILIVTIHREKEDDYCYFVSGIPKP